jgi:hypothetical protein
MRAIPVVTAAALLMLPAAGALGQATSTSQAKTPATGTGTTATTSSTAPGEDVGGAAGAQTSRGGCPTTTGQGADRSGEAKKEGTAQAGGQGRC